MTISAEDTTVSGVEPGESGPAEATERPYTLQEWILMGLERSFASEEEESEYFGSIPVPGEELATVTAEPASSELVEEPNRIRWAPATPEPKSTEASESVKEPDRIRWAPATPESKSRQPEAASEPDAAGEPQPDEAPVTIRWRSGA